jgi:hypothetical protein
MWHENSVWAALDSAKDTLRAAEEAHRVRQLLGEPRRRPTYAPLLDRLGHHLIALGLDLRARYGQLEFGENAPTLTPESSL